MTRMSRNLAIALGISLALNFWLVFMTLVVMR